MFKTRKQVKEARTLPFAEAARRFRKAIYTGELLHPRVMLALAERAEATTPREQRGTWQRYAASMRAGRRIKTMTATVTAVDGVSVEMIDEINLAAPLRERTLFDLIRGREPQEPLGACPESTR